MKLLPQNLLNGSEFHHVGVATRSIDNHLAAYEALGYKREGAPFLDPVQGVKGLFLVGSGPRIELLENLPNTGVLDPWLDRGCQMYHLGFLVDDLVKVSDWADASDSVIVKEPQISVAFEVNTFCLR